MKTLPTKKIVVLLAIGFGLLALAAVSNWHTSQQVQRNHAAVAVSHQVRGSLTRLLAAVQDVQMGQRGYLLAGDQRFLVPYTFGVQQTDFHFNRLLRLTADNPRHQERLNALKPLLDQKLAHSRDTIALRDTQGFEAAQREVASGKGQAMTDTIRLALQDMDQDEGAVLVKRSQAATKASDINTFAVVTGFGLSFVFLGVAFFLLLRANSRHRAAENDSRTKSVMLHSVLHSVGDGIGVADTAGNFLVFNPAAEKFFGIPTTDGPAPELKTQWLKPEQRTPFPAEQLPIACALRGESVSNVDILIRNSAYPTGAVLSISARPLLTESGSIMGAVVVAKEVPHRKAEARPTTPAKSQESSVRPALPNPVLPVAAAPRPAAPKPVVQPAVQPAVAKVDAPIVKKDPQPSLKTGTTLFERRPQTGTTTFERRTPLLNSVIEQTVATLRPAATLQQITLGQQLATSLPEMRFDAVRITEILTNLLTNALKHTPFGGNILVTSRQPSPDLVHISVTDSGPGIPAERCERIFDRDQTKTEGNGGMGLFTCRELVQSYGGKIWVESETGKGSTFTFSLPTLTAAAAPVTVPATAAVQTAAAETTPKPEAASTDVSSAELDEIMEQLPWNKNKAA